MGCLVHTGYSAFDVHQIFIEHLLYALRIQWEAKCTDTHFSGRWQNVTEHMALGNRKCCAEKRHAKRGLGLWVWQGQLEEGWAGFPGRETGARSPGVGVCRAQEI